MQPRLVLVFVALTLGTSTNAYAQPSPGDDDSRAKELYEQGEADYAAGRYKRAVELFAEAYVLSKRSLLLFNIANAEERQGNYQEAATALRQYVGNPDATDVDAVNERIASLERRAAEDRVRRAKEVEEGKARQPRAREAAREASKAKQVTTVARPPPTRDERPSAVPGWTLIGVGGALLASGVVTGILSRSASNDAEALCGADDVCRQGAKDDIDRARNLALVTDIAVVGGLAAAAVGTVLLIRRGSSAPEQRGLSFDVGPTADGFAASIGGHF